MRNGGQSRGILTVALAAGLAAGTGCATIMAGGPDKIPVTSTPSGAKVYVDSQPVGQTPTVVVLDRERSQGNIRVEAPGYEPTVLTRSKSINGWFWANICIGGVVGIVVDLVTGDIKRFDDTPVHIMLTPSRAPGAGAPPTASGPQQPPAVQSPSVAAGGQ